ncbi:MAG: phosphoribosyltransferase family protein [Patescibacteria group bacterium]
MTPTRFGLRIGKIILDALFPLSPAEQELLSYSPKDAYLSLPPAPDFSGLALPLPGARSVFAYQDERVSKLVWSIKYKKSPWAIQLGGYALLRMILQEHQSATTPENLKKTLIVPVPITPRRRRERGYNQCELLIDEVERLAKIESSGSFIFEKNLLIRTQHAARQTLKGRADRLESARGIFSIDHEVLERLNYQDIAARKAPVLIIDDVITTGSTVHEAIKTLKGVGFENVRALSLAH